MICINKQTYIHTQTNIVCNTQGLQEFEVMFPLPNRYPKFSKLLTWKRKKSK